MLTQIGDFCSPFCQRTNCCKTAIEGGDHRYLLANPPNSIVSAIEIDAIDREFLTDRGLR